MAYKRVIPLEAENGTIRNLRLTTAEFVAVERTVGAPVHTILKNLGVTETVLILNEGLKVDDPTLQKDEEKAGEVIDAIMENYGYAEIAKIVAGAIQNFLYGKNGKPQAPAEVIEGN